MGVRGLEGYLNKKRGWNRVDLVREAAKAPGGRLSVLVDFYGFVFFIVSDILDDTDPLRTLSQGLQTNAFDLIVKFVTSLQQSGIDLEFINDTPRGTNEDEWRQKYVVWKERAEKRMAGYEQIDTFITSLHQHPSNPSPDLPVTSRSAFDPIHALDTSATKPPLTEFVLRIITITLGLPFTPAHCEADKLVQRIMLYRNNCKLPNNYSTELLGSLHSVPPVYGVMSNDTDFAVLNGSNLLSIKSMSVSPRVSIREFLNSSKVDEAIPSLWCNTASPASIVKSVNNVITSDELSEVAIVAGCDYTHRFDEEICSVAHLMGRNFFSGLKLVSQIKRKSANPRRIEQHNGLGRLVQRNREFAGAVLSAREFFGYSLGQNDDTHMTADIIAHCNAAARYHSKLPPISRLPDLSNLNSYLDCFHRLSDVTAHMGRHWQGCVPEASHGEHFLQLTKEIFRFELLLLSPQTRTVTCVVTGCDGRIASEEIAITGSTSIQRFSGLRNGDHQTLPFERFWPSALTVCRMPNLVKLGIFEWICSRYSAQETLQNSGMLPLATAFTSAVGSMLVKPPAATGFIVQAMRVMRGLNNNMQQVEWQLKDWELRIIAVAVLLSFKRSRSYCSSKGVSFSNVSEELLQSCPALKMMSLDEKLCGKLFASDVLQSVQSACPSDHKQLIVDFRCITILSWTHECMRMLFELLQLLGIINYDGRPVTDGCVVGHAYDEAIANRYQIPSMINGNIFGWLYSAQAMQNTLDSPKCPTTGHPAWVSDEGFKVLRACGSQLKQLPALGLF